MTTDSSNQGSEAVKDTTRERPWNSYRYLLFYCPEYHPSGGMSDLTCGFDDWSEVEAYAAANSRRHMMIADMETNEFWPLSTRNTPAERP